MTYIENIFICISVPLLISLPFIGRKQRTFAIFICLGMFICLLSAYINSFYMVYYGVTSTRAAIEITPLCEELMKFFPLIIYILTFEPDTEEIGPNAIALAAGFATFENICYMVANGAGDLMFLLIRGLSAGALHILCGIAIGKGLSFAFNKRWQIRGGTIGTLALCITFHATYNLMITAEGTAWQGVGYVFPLLIMVIIYIGNKLLKNFHR